MLTMNEPFNIHETCETVTCCLVHQQNNEAKNVEMNSSRKRMKHGLNMLKPAQTNDFQDEAALLRFSKGYFFLGPEMAWLMFCDRFGNHPCLTDTIFTQVHCSVVRFLGMSKHATSAEKPQMDSHGRFSFRSAHMIKNQELFL